MRKQISILAMGGITVLFMISIEAGQPPDSGSSPNLLPGAVIPESELVLATDRPRYHIGEPITGRMTNVSERTMWLETTCGIAFTLLERTPSGWDSHDAYPLADCAGGDQPSLMAKGTRRFDLELQRVFGVRVRPGTYKLAVYYTELSPDIQAIAKFQYATAFSNEFVITDSAASQ